MSITFDLPDDARLVTAVAHVAIRHGQLDYILRMTVKTITRLKIEEALDATERQTSTELRQRIRRLARQKIGDGRAFLLLEALLSRARRASEKRNELLHGLWAVDLEDGRQVFRHEGHQWRPQPTATELEEIAKEMAEVAFELNKLRLHGELHEALEGKELTANTTEEP